MSVVCMMAVALAMWSVMITGVGMRVYVRMIEIFGK